MSFCNAARHPVVSGWMVEFYMLEAEMAFMDSLPQLLNLIESSIQQITSFIQQQSPDDIQFCAAYIDKDLPARLKTLQEPFARLTYTEAIQILSNVKRAWKHPVKWGLGLQSEHERYIAEEYTQRPTFVRLLYSSSLGHRLSNGH